jgi:hypothetical protein|tara:strand:+ start:294 stop:608 length:315 start_codon:yes stop_codon:yes gene_type:complete
MFNKKEKDMTNNKVWLVIEKTNYGENNDSFSISKTANTIEQATKFQIHLDALNDRKNRTYFLASDISTVLGSVAYHHNKSVENGTYYDNHPEVKKDEVVDDNTF